MTFNSAAFALLFAVFYPLYLISGHRRQNTLLLAASVIFYGAWDWRFLGLLFFTTAVDYLSALRIDSPRAGARSRKAWLAVSIVSNLTVLGFFKYFNFFEAEALRLLGIFGHHGDGLGLRIVLPVGISFYTFQAMSYTIDVYRRELKAVRHFPDFALYISFFPQLVAGPIERATHLLPQVLNPRRVRLGAFYEGCTLILWGLFQKMFVADNLARLVDPVFKAPAPYDGLAVLIALYAFAFQIYCDFAGYSNIARGLGKMMGFDIMRNFNLPYFASNPREFWQRWHISLSTWLRDYVYIPLGGSRNGRAATVRNLMLTMLLGGLWHGARMTFILWGLYHGLLLVIHRALAPRLEKWRIPKAVSVIIFFHLVALGWLLFRAGTVTQAYHMLTALIFHFDARSAAAAWLGPFGFALAVLWIAEFIEYQKKDSLVIFHSPVLVRAAVYYALFYLIVLYAPQGGKEFIYFQF